MNDQPSPPDKIESGDTQTWKALWVPGWYELDQPVSVDNQHVFCFYQQPPCELPQAAGYDLVFFNQLMDDANWEMRNARVESIHHSMLGEIQSVDTEGLDYIFKPTNGEPVSVNAEENPGADNSGISTNDWSLTVTLSHVSHPIEQDS